MEEKMLYKLTDVATALRVSRTKVYELIGGGVLPSVRISTWARVILLVLGASARCQGSRVLGESGL